MDLPDFVKDLPPGFDLPGAYPHKDDAPEFECKYGIFDLTDDYDKTKVEEIMSDSYNTASNPKYENKKWVLWEKSFISNEATLLAVKYVMRKDPPKKDKREPVKEAKTVAELKEPITPEKIPGRRRRKKAKNASED